MGRTALLATAVLALAAGLATAAIVGGDNTDYSERMGAKPFGRAGNEYTFAYNGQIATGLVAGGIQQEGQEASEQKSATRIAAQAKIHFHSERQASLRLEKVRIGHVNAELVDPQRVQPLGLFEPAQLVSEKRQQLELPCAFTYEEGVVSRISFHSDDEAWSKNIKRAVLNLIQLNLKRNNAQGAQGVERVGEQGMRSEEQSGTASTNSRNNNINNNRYSGKTFTLPEVNIEGECATTYTLNGNAINGRQEQQWNEQSDEQQAQQWDEEKTFGTNCANCFNVTKSVDFKRCSKIADVAYGYQTQQPQAACIRCQQQWAAGVAKQPISGQTAVYGVNGEQEAEQPHPCDVFCDPKEVKEEKLSRSTITRFVLAGKPNGRYAIKRVELVSQYVYKTLAAEHSGAAMQAIVASELIYRSAEQQPKQYASQQAVLKQLQQMPASAERDESLLFSADWDTEEKRFYMYGDEEFLQRNQPFAKVQNKADQAAGIARKLAAAANNKQNGIELDDVVQVQRLAEVLRMCSVQELKQVVSKAQENINDAEKEKIKQLIGDALAIAGTRNSIQVLYDQIIAHQLTPAKAAQTLKSLGGLPAPSDAQVDIVLKLCKNELANRNPALKQSCWLAVGGMIGELCAHKTQRAAQASTFGAQSGFAKDEICPAHKKAIYKQTLVEQFQQARNTYDKIVALKAIGNAALDTAVQQPLAEIITNAREQRIVRIGAIDALRRLRTHMPRKIQRILLPIFENTREHPELRMTAFEMIMQTQLETPIVDQIAYTLAKERSAQVASFVYTSMKALSKSKVPAQQKLAKTLKNALKLTNIDKQTIVRGSRNCHVPIFDEQQKEGLFLTFSSVISSRNAIPSQVSLAIDSLINGEFEKDQLNMAMQQQGLEAWYERVVQQVLSAARDYIGKQMTKQPTRGQRSNVNTAGAEELRKIFQGLGIKGRKSPLGIHSDEQDSNNDDYERQQTGEQQPFGMISVRIGDVDQALVSLDKRSLPTIVRQMLQQGQNGERKPSLRQLMESLEGFQQGKHFRLLAALNTNERTAKIATSLGVPLRVLSSVPMLASLDGQLKITSTGSGDSDSNNGQPKVQLQLHPNVAIAHIHRMETFLPIVATGVESIRSAEANVPLFIEMSVDQQEGLKTVLRLPTSQSKTRLAGVHTLPVTYHREFDSKTKQLKMPRVKQIAAGEQMQRLERQLETIVGAKAFGMPFHVKGHYHGLPCNSAARCYKQLVQLAFSTENGVHLTYEPTSDSPRAIRFSAQGFAFQKLDAQQHRASDMTNFYAEETSLKFEHVRFPATSDEQDSTSDEETMKLEPHSTRRQQLNSYLSQFAPSAAYKHQLKLAVHTEGGSKRFSAQATISAACDAHFKYCKTQLDAERSPITDSERTGGAQKWVLKAKAQVLTPERVSSVKELSIGGGEKKQQKFVCAAEAQWGPADKQKTQFVQVRIQGESLSTRLQNWQQIVANAKEHLQQLNAGERQQAIESAKWRAAFLNRFDLAADYRLSPSVQMVFSRVFEALKAANFWQTRAAYNTDQQAFSGNSNGQVHATVVIEPVGQQQCNVSVRTPSQTVRITSVELPTSIRPFPLVRQRPQRGSHSVQQLIENTGSNYGYPAYSYSSNGKAECKADGARVNTFDGLAYKAPISQCYHVLAKDCSHGGQPEFVVLMKNIDADSQMQKEQQQKKIKVITPTDIIECQAKNSGEKKLKCKINGESIGEQQQSRINTASQEEMRGQQQQQEMVEFDDERQKEVTIRVQGVQVRFNGRRANIRLSNAYKQAQCGLCGDYDDQLRSPADEWRMPNGERAQSAQDFHSAYALRTGNDDDCTAEEHKRFYSQQGAGAFGVEKWQQQQWADNDDQQENGIAYGGHVFDSEETDIDYESGIGSEQDNNNDEDSNSSNSSEEQSWWGEQPSLKKKLQQQKQRWSAKKRQQQLVKKDRGQQQQDFSGSDNSDFETVEPMKATKVIEYSHMICFSNQPVKQCPTGSVPAENSQQQQNGSDYDQEESNDKQSVKKMQFSCLPRSSIEARRLQRQARQGGVVDVSAYQPSFVEAVKQPKSCIRY